MKTEEVAARLQKKFNSGMRCPMCGGSRFQLVNGFFLNGVQKDMNSFQVGGESIPTVAVVCVNCGFLSQHAIGVLDPEILGTDKDDDGK